MRQAHGEVAGARSYVRHRGIGLERQGLDHLMRLLPGVAAGVVEHLGPVLGAAEAVLVGVGRLRVRRPGHEAGVAECERQNRGG